ncbi:hypothetical protein E2C01_010263 [Portunus trituberculatus]|uniref:Uncharacterized protein n=1 Tax=Portunus trituberculatus TaxID=210409 RepID=A0A5B7D7X3_PORTR|nr:hypothetical protein [Portunus trituberculatus]
MAHRGASRSERDRVAGCGCPIACWLCTVTADMTNVRNRWLLVSVESHSSDKTSTLSSHISSQQGSETHVTLKPCKGMMTMVVAIT